MQSLNVQRLRITFSKTGATRFIGHLDVARTWERALNRAKLPVSYSQGFNRRPKIQFATATSLGMTSQCELVDVWLTERVEVSAAHAQIGARMAPGLSIVAVEEVPLGGPALQMLIRASTYTAVIPPDLLPYELLAERVAAVVSAEQLIRQRTSKGKAKSYDLRPHILNLTIAPTPTGEALLTMELVLTPTHTGRPDELLSELGLDPLDVLVHRVALTIGEEADETADG